MIKINLISAGAAKIFIENAPRTAKNKSKYETERRGRSLTQITNAPRTAKKWR